MSWTARRYNPGKPILRAVRHRKHQVDKALEDAGAHAPPTESELSAAIRFAQDYKLHRLAAICFLAANFSVADRHGKFLMKANDELEIECANWKFRYLQERQKVLALEAKIGYLRQRRQSSRTRMRAGTPGIRSSFPSLRR
jgi:hypothetical protein